MESDGWETVYATGVTLPNGCYGCDCKVWRLDVDGTVNTRWADALIAIAVENGPRRYPHWNGEYGQWDPVAQLGKSEEGQTSYCIAARALGIL